MGRWTQYDEDAYRLPSGFMRTGYDSDTGQYTFADASGVTWHGAPNEQYGVMHRGSQSQSTSGTRKTAASKHPQRSNSFARAVRNLAKRIRSLSVPAPRYRNPPREEEKQVPFEDSRAAPLGTTASIDKHAVLTHSAVESSVSIIPLPSYQGDNKNTLPSTTGVTSSAILTEPSEKTCPGQHRSACVEHASKAAAEVKLFTLNKSVTLPSRHPKSSFKPQASPAKSGSLGSRASDKTPPSVISVQSVDETPPVPPKDSSTLNLRRRVTSPSHRVHLAVGQHSESPMLQHYPSSHSSKPKLNAKHESSASGPHSDMRKSDISTRAAVSGLNSRAETNRTVRNESRKHSGISYTGTAAKQSSSPRVSTRN